MYASKLVNASLRLTVDTVKTRLPIKKTMLMLLVNTIDSVFDSPQPYLCAMYKALMVTAYYGLFRVGELTQSPHVIKACDVYVGVNKRKFRFVLHSSKTHNRGDNPQIIKIKCKDTNADQVLDPTQQYVAALCPFELVDDYIRLRSEYSSDQDQFFVFSDSSPVQPEHFRTILKKTIKLRKLEPGRYGTHSFRAGRSVDLFEMGVLVETIKNFGRWTSSAVYKYLK